MQDVWRRRIPSASGRLSQMGFELGEGLFNWIEIGAVRRQVAKADTSIRKDMANSLDFVCGQVIQNERVARTQAGSQHLLEINQEDLGVHWPLHQKRSIYLLMTQGRDERGSLPMTLGHRTETALAALAAAIQSSQFGVQTRFINKHQTTDIPIRLLAPPESS